MELPILQMPRARSMPYNIGLLICNIALTSFLCIMVIVLVVNIAPIVPDLIRILKVVDDTLADVNVMLPELNGTLWDMRHVLPGIKQTIYYTKHICDAVGCL